MGQGASSFNRWKNEDVDPKEWEISIGMKKSTGHLSGHMMSHHRDLHDADILVKAQAAGRYGNIMKFAKPTGGQNSSKDREDRQLYCWCKHVVMEMVPLHTSESPTLRLLHDEIAKNPHNVVHFGWDRVRAKLIELAGEVLVGVKELLNDQTILLSPLIVGLQVKYCSLDYSGKSIILSVVANQGYISLTAHWIDDDFILRSANLLCEYFPGNHTADAVNKKVYIVGIISVVNTS